MSDAGASLATLLSIALALLLVALALAFTPLLIAALFTLTLLLLISVALSLPLLLLVTPVLFPLALLLLVPLFALALLTLLISLPTFRLGPVLPSLGFALAFALPLTLSLSPLVLAGGLFPLAAAAHFCLERLVETFPCPDLDRGLVLGQHLLAYVDMSFGGFLGVGAEEHAIPWSKLTYDPRLGGYQTDIGESQLQGSPAFSRDRNWDWKDRNRERELHDHYRARYYWDE